MGTIVTLAPLSVLKAHTVMEKRLCWRQHLAIAIAKLLMPTMGLAVELVLVILVGIQAIFKSGLELRPP